jgi:hypothetical protein
MKCTECNGSGEAIYFVETDRDENTVTVEKRKCICRTCNGSGKMPMTNADRIRAMTDEELAEVFGKLVHCGGCPMRGNCKVDNLPCDNVLLDWLQQPAEGDA